MARAAQLRVVGTAFLRRRPLITAPIAVATLALFALAGAPTPQLVALAIGVGALHVMFVTERILGARRPLSEAALARSLAATTIGIAAGCFVSGRLASPLVPLLLAPTGVAFAAFGRGRTSNAMLGLLGAVAIGLAVSPGVFPALRAPHVWIALAIALAGCALLLRLGVATLADAHAAASETLGRAGEDAAARARELETLGARVAHEVKNPLAAIRGLVEVMREAHADPADRDHRRLTVIAGEVERIEGLLRDYLAPHGPGAELAREDVDVGVIVRDVAAVLEARAERAEIALSADGPALRAMLDPRRLKEALLNLALNAVQAVPAGGRVDLRWARDGDAIAIEVADTGRGMSTDELAQLGTAGFTTRAGGTGLGVVLARAVIEQHGGRLDFRSEPGRGTIATVRVPWRPS